MIIHPPESLHTTYADAVAGLNFEPKAGDEGHTDDHGRLAKVLFDIPQTRISVGIMSKQDGEWVLIEGGNPDPSLAKTVSFSELREYAEQVGAMVVANGPHAAADGVTDWTEDHADLDGITANVVASGVVGLSHSVADLLRRLTMAEGRLAALEQG